MEILTFATVALSIFLVMNPFSSIPTFLSITKDVDRETLRSYANRAVIVAGILLFVFVFIGSALTGLSPVVVAGGTIYGFVLFFVFLGAVLTGWGCQKEE